MLVYDEIYKWLCIEMRNPRSFKGNIQHIVNVDKNTDKILATNDSRSFSTSRKLFSNGITRPTAVPSLWPKLRNLPTQHLVIGNLNVEPVGWTALSRGTELSSNALLARLQLLPVT